MNSRANRSWNRPPNRRKCGRPPPVANYAERHHRVEGKVETYIGALRAGERPVDILMKVRATKDPDLNFAMFPILEAAQLERVRVSASRRWARAR